MFEIVNMIIIYFHVLLVIVIGVEKIIGWALSHHFMHKSESSIKEAKLVISGERSN